MISWMFRYLKYRSIARLISRGDVEGLAKREVRKAGYRQLRRIK